MNNYIQQAANEEVKAWINGNLARHIKRTKHEDVGEIEHIIDYLNSEAAPKRLQKMSYTQAKAKAEAWLATQVKKGATIKETEADTETTLTLPDGFRLAKLVGENAFKREGFLMSHCVASYFGKNQTSVYSLRDKDNNPHCTIEISGDTFQQIKGKGNGTIHPRYINYVISILEHFGISVRESEMENLGYTTMSDDFAPIFHALYINDAQITLNGTTYYQLSHSQERPNIDWSFIERAANENKTCTKLLEQYQRKTAA